MLINSIWILLSWLMSVDWFNIYQSTDWRQLADFFSFLRELFGFTREMSVVALPWLSWFLNRKLKGEKGDVPIEKVEEKEKDDNPQRDRHL